MSVFQRWFPLALGAACLFACGDDSTGSDDRDSGVSDYDSSLNPIEGDGDDRGDGDGDGDGDIDGDGDSDSGHDETLTDAGSTRPDSGTKPPGRDASVPNPKPDASTPTPSGTPVFVAVGYSGRHLRSTDLGVTWTDEEFLDPQRAGGDDRFLLRAVTFGNGKFVPAGWRILVSEDGSAGSWTEHTLQNQQWVGGLQYGNGLFVGTGGYGMAIHSTDGLTWTSEGDLDTNASRSLAFGDGKFMSATDQGNWWVSTNGVDWNIDSGGHNGSQIAYCGDFKTPDQCSGNFSAKNRAFGEGVTIRANGGKLERSTDGVSFKAIPNTGNGIEAVAFGYVE